VKELLNKITSFYKKISEVATPTVVLAIICVVVTLALSSANALTHKKIKALAIENQNKAMAKLMEGEYEELTHRINNGDAFIKYHIVKKEGKEIGFIFVTSAKGYGGEIQVMTAVNIDLTVAAIEILDASGETPGLGQNVTKESFFSQFVNHKKDISVIKGGGANLDNNEIHAVTGATISSKAVTGAVNTALQYAEEIIVSNTDAKEDVPLE
jgi:electron transport complex protein RnfG